MKVSIYEENHKTEPEKEICYRLVQGPSCVYLVIVDKEGGGIIPFGYVAELTEDGCMKLCLNVSTHVGLQLDRSQVLPTIKMKAPPIARGGL